MFESIISNILVKYLGEYVENLDPKSLSIAVWQGNLDLYDLKLRRSAFDAFNLPVVVVQGYIGKLRLSIPWTSLSSSPVIAEISDIFLVVKPKKNVHTTEEEQITKEQNIKKKKLETYDTMRAQKNEEEKKKNEELKKSETFLSKLTETVVNNVQIKIHNVHARYEDLSDANNFTLFGVTLKTLSVESCNEKWEKTFIKDSQRLVFKLAELKELSVYMNHEDNTIFSSIQSGEAFRQLMKKSISDKSSKKYLVKPIDGKMKVVLQKEGSIDLNLPKYTIDLIFDTLSLSLDDRQYRNTLRLVEYLSNYQQIEELSIWKPRLDPSASKEARREWLKYAFKSACKLTRKNYFSWSDVKQRNKDRVAYIELYKRKKGVPWMQKLEGYDLDRFNGLERKLDFDSIALFRELAEAEIKEESKKYSQYQQTVSKKSRGWFSWGYTEEEVEESDFTMKEEDRQRLYKTIGYDVSDEVKKNKLPKDFVKLNVNFLLNGGDISIVDSTSNKSIVTIEYKELRADFRMKEESMLGSLTLDELKVMDNFTKNTLFETILYRQNTVVEKKKLVAISFETNPPSGKSDLYIKILLDQIDIVMNMTLIQKILSFFIIPSDIDLSTIQNIAKKQLSNLQQQAQTQLRLALQSKKILDIDLAIESPQFIFPEDCLSGKCEILLFHLGKLQLRSNIDKSERIRRLKNQDLKDEDYYDRFTIKMSEIQIIHTNYPELKNVMYYEIRGNRLLEKVSFSLTLAICITPNNIKLPQTVVKGDIPSIKLKFSPTKFTLVLKIMNQVFAVVDNPTGLSKHQVKKKGTMRVSGPLVKDDENEWKDCVVELQNRRLQIYDSENATKAIATIAFCEKTIVKDVLQSASSENEHLPLDKQDSINTNGFSVVLPQTSGNDAHFIFLTKNKVEWMDELKQIILESASSSQGSTSHASSSNAPKQEDIKSPSQVIVTANLLLQHFSLVINYKNQDISEITFNTLDLSCNVRNYDLYFNMKLKSFQISDLLDATKKYILLSSQLKTADLVDLTFINARPNSPFLTDESDWKEILHDTASAVKFNFSKLELFFDPNILSKFVTLGYDLSNIFQATSKGRTRYFAVTEKKKETEVDNIGESSRKSSFKVQANMEDMSLILVDFGSTFTGFSMSKTKVLFKNNPSGVHIDGEVGDLQAIDYSDDTFYREILGVSSKKHSLITFSFSLANDVKPEKEGIPYYNKFLKAKMHSVKFVFLMRLIRKLQLYFSEGPLLEALKAGSQKAAQYSLEAVKKQSENIQKIKFDLEFINPLVMVPVAYNTSDKIIGNLGKIQVKNDLFLQKESDQMKSNGSKYVFDNWYERIIVELKSMNLRTNLKSRLSNVVEKADMSIHIDLAVLNKANEIPGIDFWLEVPDVSLKMSHSQYQMIFGIIRKNFGDTGGFDVKKQELPQKKNVKQLQQVAMNVTKDISGSKSEDKQDEKETEQKEKPKGYQNEISSRYMIRFPNINLSLLRGSGTQNGREDRLARLHMYGLSVIYVMHTGSESSAVTVEIEDVNAFDERIETKSDFKKFISSIKENVSDNSIEKIDLSKEPSKTKQQTKKQKKPAPFVHFLFQKRNSDQMITFVMGDPRIIFVPSVVMEIKNFFTDMYPEEKVPSNDPNSDSPHCPLTPIVEGDMCITNNTWLGEDLIITPKRRMVFKKNDQGELTLNGDGHTITLYKQGNKEDVPLIEIEDGMHVKVCNVLIKYIGDINSYLAKGNYTKFSAPATQGVVHCIVDSEDDLLGKNVNEQDSTQGEEEKAKEVKSGENEEEKNGRLTMSMTLGKPSIIFPEDANDKNTRLFIVELGLIANYTKQADLSEDGVFQIENLKAYVESQGSQIKGAPVIEPISLHLDMASEMLDGKLCREFKFDIDSNLKARIAYQDVQLITKVVQAFNKKESEEDKQKAIEEALQSMQVPPIKFIDDEDANSSADTDDRSSGGFSTDSESDRFDDEDDDDFKEAKSDDENEKNDTKGESKDKEEENDDEFADLVQPEKKVQSTEQQQQEIINKDATEQFYSLKFFCSKVISVLIVDDYRGYDIPLIDFNIDTLQLDSDIAIKNLMNISATLNFSIFANFYNMNIADWEPIVEKWGCIVLFKRVPTDVMNPLYRNEMMITNAPAQKQETIPPLNINVSKSMIDTVTNTAKLWREGLTSNQSVSARFDPYCIRNHTFDQISFFRDDKVDAIYLVQPSKEKSFDFPEYSGRSGMEQWKKELWINITVPNMEPYRINVRRVGKNRIINNQAKLIYMIDIEQIEGRKIITVRSALKIYNNTTLPWELGLYINDEVKPFGLIEPQGNVGVPVINAEEATLCVRPMNEEKYEWSEPILGFKLAEILKNPSLNRLFTCKNANVRESERSFHCVLKVNTEHFIDTQPSQSKGHPLAYQQSDFILHLTPPLSIENLLGVELDYELFDRTTSTSRKMLLCGGKLKRGEKMYAYNANLKNSILMGAVLSGSGWKRDKIAILHSNEKPPKTLTRRLTIWDEKKNGLDLIFEYCNLTGKSHREVIIYTPYWIINKTGLKMNIRDGSTTIAGMSILNQQDSGKSDPLMFTYKEGQPNKKISISVNESNYSRSFSIDNPGVAGDIELLKDKKYNIGLYVTLAPGKFKRTKMVTFSARFVIVNKSAVDIYFKQTQSARVFVLKSKDRVNFYWPEIAVSSPSLSITTDKVNYEWSSPLKLNALGEVPLKILQKQNPFENPCILTVNVLQDQGTLFAVITKPEKPPYVILNQTDEDVDISQVGVSNASWKILKNSRFPFSWDESEGTQRLNIKFQYNIVNSFDINKVYKPGEHTKLTSSKGNKNYFLSVHARGPTRVLRIAAEPKVDDTEEEVFSLRVVALVKSAGVSLINNKPEEIAFFWLEELNVKYDQTNLHNYIEVTVQNLQLDNQLYDAPFPVLISRTNLENKKPFIHFSMTRASQESNINLFPYFSINVQEMNVAMDYSFIKILAELFKRFSESTDQEDEEAAEAMLKSLEDVAPELETSKKIYFNVFELHPIKMNLTFKISGGDSSEEESNPILLFLRSLGVTLVNIDDAPIKLNALILDHAFLSQPELIDRIKVHYFRAGTYELYKIIGSLDIIGNPVGLFNDITTGWKDFFYEPANAITKSPEEFGRGIAKGTSSLIGKSIHGTFNTASKFTGSVGKTLKLLSFDKDFIKEGEKSSTKNRPRDLGEGLKEGGEALAKSVMDGVFGIVTKPLEGANREGALGFLKGVGIGIVGVPVKPVVGLFDFAHKTTEGISNTQKIYQLRVRYPRTFREDGALTAYSQYEAYGQYLLNEVMHEKCGEKVLFYCVNETKSIIMLTNKYIMSIKLPSNIIEWKIDLYAIESLARDNKGAVLVGYPTEQKSGLFGTSTSRVILTKRVNNPQDAEINAALFNKLKSALKTKKKLSIK